MRATYCDKLLCGRLVYDNSYVCIQGGPKIFPCSLLISLKRVVTEIVLFSIVALKTLDISQGSVATHLRCGGIFSCDSIITRFLLILTVK